tara:strand:- start:1806 stop:2300 length:495 start_codon:yes stop_codon:yes gene_type:complete
MTFPAKPGRPPRQKPQPLDPLDKLLINSLQGGFPLTVTPYRAVGESLGLSESQVIERIGALLARGVLTRFGPLFDAEKLGGAFCLCAMSVPPAQFSTVLTKVNAHREVAHNYERAHHLNMWFVLAVERPAQIEQTARIIEQECGIEVHLFPKEEEFFIGLKVTA